MTRSIFQNQVLILRLQKKKSNVLKALITSDKILLIKSMFLVTFPELSLSTWSKRNTQLNFNKIWVNSFKSNFWVIMGSQKTTKCKKITQLDKHLTNPTGATPLSSAQSTYRNLKMCNCWSKWRKKNLRDNFQTLCRQFWWRHRLRLTYQEKQYNLTSLKKQWRSMRMGGHLRVRYNFWIFLRQRLMKTRFDTRQIFINSRTNWCWERTRYQS